MKPIYKTLFGSLCAAALLPTSATALELDALTQESRAAVRDFGGALMSEVQQAFMAGGPLNVISVCQSVAPGMGAQFSDKHNMEIERTALKFRNPANMPDNWERRVMVSFLERQKAGEQLQGMEHTEILMENGKPVYRYMMAIPVAEPCLACHGTDIRPEITRALDKAYPTDTARGFKAGELRGAFTLRREM